MELPGRLIGATLGLMLLLGGTAAANGEVPVRPDGAGSMVLIGGHLSSKDASIYREILDRRLDGKPICILPTASDNPGSTIATHLEDIRRLGEGGAAVGIRLTYRKAERANTPQMAQRLSACGGFLFTSGDPSRIVETFKPGGKPSAALGAVLRVFHAGGVVAGFGAGAAALGEWFIEADAVAEPSRDRTRDNAAARRPGIAPGLGLFADSLLDPRTTSSRGAERLLHALSGSPGAVGRGYRLVENSAIVATGSTVVTIGSSVITAVDPILPAVRGPSIPQRIDSWKLFLLSEGDGYDRATGEFRPAPDKRELQGGSDAVTDPRSITSGGELVRELVGLALTDDSTVSLTREELRFDLTKMDGFRLLARGDGPLREPFAGPFALKIESPLSN